MKTVEVQGRSVAYLEAGEGRPLVLLHSLGTSKRLWEESIPALAQRYHVLAPDYPGHGDSEPPAREWTIPDYAAHIVSFMDVVGVERAAVAGTSLGGVVGIELGARHGKRVDRLVLNGCPGWHLEEQRMARLITVLGNVNPETGLQNRPNPGGTVRPFSEDERAARVADIEKAGRWFTSAMWAIAAYDLSARLARISCPTLVLMGTADFHMATSYTLSHGIPNAELSVMDNVGHLSPYDDPSLVADRITTFLEETGYGD